MERDRELALKSEIVEQVENEGIGVSHLPRDFGLTRAALTPLGVNLGYISGTAEHFTVLSSLLCP